MVKKLATLCMLVSIALSSGCRTNLEAELQHERQKSAELRERNNKLHEKLVQLYRKAVADSKILAEVYRENFSLLESKDSQESLFKSGRKMSVFKHPETKQDIFVEVNIKDYLTARAFPSLRRRDEDLVEPDNKYVKILISKLGLRDGNQEYNAQKILNFVQGVPYIKDDYPYTKSVTETIAENSGDCEDHAVLASSMLKSIGIDSIQKTFVDPEKKIFVHRGIVVAGNFKGKYFEENGKKYFYAETTNSFDNCDNRKYWQIGDFPKNLLQYIPKPCDEQGR